MTIVTIVSQKMDAGKEVEIGGVMSQLFGTLLGKPKSFGQSDDDIWISSQLVIHWSQLS